MAELNRWQTLVCPCGSTRFYQLYELRRQTSGGLSRDPVGERCAACQKDVDVAAMLRAMQLARRKQELAAMEAELAELAPAGPPPVPSI